MKKFNQAIYGKGIDPKELPSVTSEWANKVSYWGWAYRALWGDLAEFYRADKPYPAGTLITIGAGTAEISEAKTECNGIISTNPGYELGEKTCALDLPVALVGKVPVLMDKNCSVEFGNRIYLSRTTPGCASTIPNGRCLGKIIDKDENLSQKSTVMCSVSVCF